MNRAVVERNLRTLSEAVPAIVSEAAESDVARARELAASADLLARVVDLVRPAIDALGTRPLLFHEVRWDGGSRVDDRPVSARWRGVRLAGAGPQSRTTQRSPDGGVYEGRDLLLVRLQDESEGQPPGAALVALRYAGAWDDRLERWEATLLRYPSFRAALEDGWGDVAGMIEALAYQARRSVGGREKASRKAVNRAERLEAIVRLLR